MFFSSSDSFSLSLFLVAFFLFTLSFVSDKECFRGTLIEKYFSAGKNFTRFVKLIFTLIYGMQKGGERAERVEKYLCEERNSVGVVVYYSVVLIGYVLALDFFSSNSNSTHDDGKGKSLGDFWFTLHAILGIISHIVVLNSDPGIITARNHKVCYKMFPFDDLLYEEGKLCRTLNIEIPARSKWDVVTNRRVCKFDHYCSVVNQTIGLRNLRWFVLFLIVNGALCLHGGLVCWNRVMRGIPKYWHSAKEKDFFGAFLPALMYHHTRSMFSIFVLFSVGFSILGFALYHIYLVSTNVTTNETYKYAHMRRVNKRLPKVERIDVVNIWNRGVVLNVKEFLFPMRVY